MRRQGLWVTPVDVSHAPMRLFCLPFAGAGPGAFYRWAQPLQDLAELWTLQLPGRGSRFNEAPLRRWDDAMARLADDIAPLLDRPYALLGHSLGGRLAAGLCLRLQTLGLPLPQQLVVSGSLPPHCGRLAPHLHQLDEQAFVDELRVLGGTPEAILSNPRMLAPFMPVLRADFELFESCRWPDQRLLPVDIEIWAGLDDPRVAPEVALRWADLAGRRVREVFFPGGHMFIAPEQAEAACWAALKRCLASKSVQAQSLSQPNPISSTLPQPTGLASRATARVST